MKYLIIIFSFFLLQNVNGQDVSKIREAENYDKAFEAILQFDYSEKDLKIVAELFEKDLEGFKEYYIYDILFYRKNINDRQKSLIEEVKRLSREIEALKKSNNRIDKGLGFYKGESLKEMFSKGWSTRKISSQGTIETLKMVADTWNVKLKSTREFDIIKELKTHINSE